jgi:hypothetical protein
MREDDDPGALVGEFQNRRHDALDARHVGDMAVPHRHVEVGAHQHALASYIGLIERLEAHSAFPVGCSS